MPKASPHPSKQILIRPAQLVDLPQIGHLGAEIFTNTFGYSMPLTDLSTYLLSAYSITSLTQDFYDKDVTIIVATPALSPQCIIGFSQLRRGTTEPCLAGIEKLVELQRLYVDPEFHGAGIGKELTREMERIAKDEGFENLWLGVWEKNFKAQRVYERMGFGKVGDHDFIMGECTQTDWVMLKRL